MVTTQAATQNYSAAVLNGTDYFPFGSEMRSSTLAKYRYGFNGKELDRNKEFGILNQYDYGFRIYNPGIGRFLSVDPLIQKYPELTPYQFASNTPIWAIDLDGGEVKLIPNGNEGTQQTHNVFEGNAFVSAKFVTYIYHAGSPQKQAGWCTSDDYYSYLKDVAYEHGRVDAVRTNTKMPLSKFTGPFQFERYFTADKIDANWVKGYGGLYSSAYGEGYKNGMNSATGQIITNDIDFEIISILSGLELASFLRLGLKKTESNLATSLADDVVESAAKNGSTVANRLGQKMHNAYKADEVLARVRIKEFSLPSGKRIDFIDLEKKIIYELKPNNPRSIKLGYKQLEMYKQEVESIYGKGFKTVLDTY